MVNCIIVGICSQCLAYYVGFFPGSIFVNAGLIITADLLSSALVAWYVRMVGLKHNYIYAYICTGISYLAYLSIPDIVIFSYIVVFGMTF